MAALLSNSQQAFPIMVRLQNNFCNLCQAASGDHHKTRADVESCRLRFRKNPEV